eukprot:tig00000711_g3423.t1
MGGAVAKVKEGFNSAKEGISNKLSKKCGPCGKDGQPVKIKGMMEINIRLPDKSGTDKIGYLYIPKDFVGPGPDPAPAAPAAAPAAPAAAPKAPAAPAAAAAPRPRQPPPLHPRPPPGWLRLAGYPAAAAAPRAYAADPSDDAVDAAGDDLFADGNGEQLAEGWADGEGHGQIALEFDDGRPDAYGASSLL